MCAAPVAAVARPGRSGIARLTLDPSGGRTALAKPFDGRLAADVTPAARPPLAPLSLVSAAIPSTPSRMKRTTVQTVVNLGGRNVSMTQFLPPASAGSLRPGTVDHAVPLAPDRERRVRGSGECAVGGRTSARSSSCSRAQRASSGGDTRTSSGLSTSVGVRRRSSEGSRPSTVPPVDRARTASPAGVTRPLSTLKESSSCRPFLGLVGVEASRVGS